MSRITFDSVVRFLAATVVVVFCIQVFSDNKADVDLWGNVGFVKALPWSAGFHRTNTYSFTDTDQPWINHEWLSEYVLHTTHEHLGNTGLLALKVMLGMLTVLLMYLSMRKDCASGPARFFCILLMISTMGYGFSTRPHLFTYLFYSMFLFVLKWHPANKRLLLILLPAIGLLWANFHGAFFIGIVLLVAFAGLRYWESIRKPASYNSALRVPSPTVLSSGGASSASPAPEGLPDRLLFDKGNYSSVRPRVILGAAALVTAVSFINPYGPKLWEFIIRSFGKPRPYLSEWAMFDPVANFFSHVDFIVLVVIIGACLLYSRRPRDTTWMVLLGLSFLAAITMRRNIPLFAITAGFVAAEHIGSSTEDSFNRILARLPRIALAAILAVFVALSARYAAHFNKAAPLEIEIRQDRFPVEVFDFMKENGIRGNALVFFDWAEYCIWHTPECRVFLDGRFQDAYRTKTIDDYFDFIYARGNKDNALRDYPVNIILIHAGNPAAKEMQNRPEWQRVFANEIAWLFLKKDSHAEFLGSVRWIHPPRRQVALFP